MGSKRTIDRVAQSGRTLRFGLLLAFAVLVLARLPNVILEGRFFGEEGSNFFAYAWHMPWQDALLHPLGGYLNIVASGSTLLAKALVTSGWLSLEKAPYVTILIALFFQCCPAALILSANDSWLKPWWAKPMALLMLATPPMVEEVWLHSLHSQFHLAVCVALIIACRVPQKGRGWRLALLGLAPLTGPAAIVLLPLLALRAAVERKAARLLQAAALAAGSALQLLVFYTPSPVRSFHLDLNSIAAILTVRHIALPFGTPVLALATGEGLIPAFQAGETVWWPLALCVVLFGGLGLVMLQRWKEPPVWLAVAALMLAGASYFGALNPVVELLDTFRGERYTYTPQVLLNLSLLALATTREGWVRKVAMALSLWLVAVGIAIFPHKTPITEKGPNWSSEVRQWRQDPNHQLELWPEGWYADLRPGPATCDPAAGPPRSFCDANWEERQRTQVIVVKPDPQP